MYVHSVKLKNYKSFGETLNEVIVEPNITAIIGKNESGKSNVLEGLSHIDFLGNMTKAFNAENINRNSGSTASIEYEIALKPTAKDEENGIIGDSLIIISKESYKATGSILQYFNDYLKNDADSLVKTLGKNPFQLRDQDYNNYQTYISALQPTDSLHIRRINASFKFFEARLSKLSSETKESTEAAIDSFKGKWMTIVNTMPVIFYRNSNKILRSYYKLEDVQKELENPFAYPDSLLCDFINLIDIPQSDFINAVQAGALGPKITVRNRISRAINAKINEAFKEFYIAESVYLDALFDSGNVSFSVRTNEGEALSFSERSNGLRWYLNTFIDALAHGISRSNVLYLFDEPGTALHVNAQKELLSLFDDLASKGNQIVYSTHSPYMLNLKENGIHRIRSVVKNNDGFTYIYNKAYDGRIFPENQQDTYAPIINAIGMNLQDTFGPAKDKLNVVCEGISDYIYFHTMSEIINGSTTNMNFIPTVGATNCVNICNILNGWGCNFIAVFDYDKEGVEKGGNKMGKSLLYNLGKDYVYLKEVDDAELTLKTYSKDPFMIEDLIGRVHLKEYIRVNNLPEDADQNNKVLLARMFCTALESGKISISEDAKANFSNLFNRMQACR